GESYVRRLTILLAAVGALLLLPAANASAFGPVTVTIEGTGSGTIEKASPFLYAGIPPIECKYTSPGPTTGTCEGTLSKGFGGEENKEGILVKWIAAEGSEFVGWEVEGGTEVFGCSGISGTCLVKQPLGTEGPVNIYGYFNVEANKQTLTVKRTGAGGNKGFVNSSPSGIFCGATCEAKFNEGSEVTL